MDTFVRPANEVSKLNKLKACPSVIGVGASIKSATVEKARITQLTLNDGSAVGGSVFVDATYEGDLMASDGVAYAAGRERRDEFGEVLAGIRLVP